MGNEMGNRNVSGLQEEEKAAVEAPEKILQEAGVIGENHIVLEDDDTDCHGTVEASSSLDDPSGAIHSRVEKRTPEQEESYESASEGNEIQSASLPEESGGNENLTEPNSEGDILVTSVHLIKEPISVKRDEVEISDLTCDTKSTSHDLDQESDGHDLAEGDTETLVEEIVASPKSSEEIIGLGLSCHDEEKVYLVNTKTAQKTVSLADDTEFKPQSIDAPKESNDAATKDSGIHFSSPIEEENAYETLIEINLEGSLGTSDDIIQNQLSFRREEVSNSTFDSKSASEDEDPNSNEDELVDVHAETLVEDSDATSRDNEEFIWLNISPKGGEGHLIAKETAENTAAISVSDDNGQDLENKTDELLMNDEASKEEKLINITFDVECKILSLDEAGEGVKKMTITINEVDSSKSEFSSAPLEVVLKTGSAEVFEETSEPQDKSIVLTEEAKLIGTRSENEDICCDNANVSQSETMKIEFDKKQNEKENEIDVSSSNVENIYIIEDKGQINETQVVFVEEVTQKVAELGKVPPELTFTDHSHEENKVTEDINKKQEEDPYSNVNESNKRETAENCISSAKQIQGLLPQSPYTPPPFISQNIIGVPVGVAETETSTNMFHEKCTKEEIPSGFEGEESVSVELRKSPSFDFDLSNEARSQESDQSPFLIHEKTSVGSLSIRDDAGFQIQNSSVQNEHGQGALQYEPILVEEKTIRMERSDSIKSRAPFNNVLKKEEQANFAMTTQRGENQATARKEPNDEVALKRKPKSYYLFSTCICCAAAVN